MRRRSWLVGLPTLGALAAVLLGLAPIRAGAQSIDQNNPIVQEAFLDDPVIDAQQDAYIQTFTAGESGRLTSVDLYMYVAALTPHIAPVEVLDVAIVTTTPLGVPTQTVLGSGSISLHTIPDNGHQWVPIDLTATDLRLVRDRKYGIQVTSASTPHPPFDEYFQWSVSLYSKYPRGELFARQPGGYVQDQYGVWAGFRTWMVAIAVCGDGAVTGDETCDDGNTAGGDGCSSTCQHEYCGDGEPGPHEQCDDGNTVDGDGCNATCEREYCGDAVTNDVVETCDDGNTIGDDGCGPTCLVEGCGDGVVNGAEWCDDGNTLSNDGCAADCTLEPAGAACRNAVLKAAQKYSAARLAALARCQQQLASGKPLSVTDPADCASETAAAKKLAKAAAAARRTIAAGPKPKCRAAEVALLGACADTVDGLVSPDAATGCLRAEGDAAVDALLEGLFP
jgi:cysteine-rich repeat protein